MPPPVDIHDTLVRLGVAFALGLLVGLQRERVESSIGGIRTFPLIAVCGAVAGLAAEHLGPWLVAAGAIALAALLVMSDVAQLRDDPSPGLTTEVAALLMYAVGAYAAVGHLAAAVAVGGAVVLLLHLKRPMHRTIEALGERDMTAIMQFALVSLIVLPVLPDDTFGPYSVLNPREVWWMVVLIVSISLAGYVASRLFGERSGALLGGVLGGVVSSTATTVSYARRTRAASGSEPRAGGSSSGGRQDADAAQSQSQLAALVIVLASAVAFARVLVEIAVVAPRTLGTVAPPLAAMLGWMLVLSAAAYLTGRHGEAELAQQSNPAELKAALVFGALYAVIILAVAFAKDRFGDVALYPLAIVSGMTDVDAITLSTANLAEQRRLDASTTWRVILVAALANLVFKGAAACVLGAPALRTRIAVLFGLAVAGGLAILLLWP